MKLDKLWNHPEDGDYIEFDFDKKITLLLGKNGDGKTSFMRSIEQKLRHDEEFFVINDDARNRGDHMGNIFDPEHLVSTRFSSEGETLIHTIGTMLQKVKYHHDKGQKVILCLDKADSGLSIDRIKEVVDFLLDKDVSPLIHRLVVSANSYELASQFLIGSRENDTNTLWIKDMTSIKIPSTYKEFIDLYLTT